jgi:hypothetical protein
LSLFGESDFGGGAEVESFFGALVPGVDGVEEGVEEGEDAEPPLFL